MFIDSEVGEWETTNSVWKFQSLPGGGGGGFLCAQPCAGDVVRPRQPQPCPREAQSSGGGSCISDQAGQRLGIGQGGVCPSQGGLPRRGTAQLHLGELDTAGRGLVF